jgi:hypothetical protein
VRRRAAKVKRELVTRCYTKHRFHVQFVLKRKNKFSLILGFRGQPTDKPTQLCHPFSPATSTQSQSVLAEMNRNLNLDISIGGLSNGEACHYQNDEGSTYKDEGLSVGSDHMRLYGDEVEVKTLKISSSPSPSPSPSPLDFSSAKYSPLALSLCFLSPK